MASEEAASLCIAKHLQGEEIPVTARFSSGSGKPTRADGAHDERGMAVKFHLPDGSSTDIVSLTLPVFFVRTPEDFLAFLEVQRPDPETGKPDLDRIGAFIDQHPETQKAVGFVMMTEAPDSFGGCTFHGIHAFRATAPDGTKDWIRYHWIPEQPAGTLTDEATRALGKNYLHAELEERLGKGPIAFELQAQVADPGDDTNDPTSVWPDDRRVVSLGTMTLNGYTGHECDPMIFDPGNLTDGLERSDDPILHARSAAYSVSFERRTRS